MAATFTDSASVQRRLLNMCESLGETQIARCFLRAFYRQTQFMLITVLTMRIWEESEAGAHLAASMRIWECRVVYVAE